MSLICLRLTQPAHKKIHWNNLLGSTQTPNSIFTTFLTVYNCISKVISKSNLISEVIAKGKKKLNFADDHPL